jgi:hypothetical protein
LPSSKSSGSSGSAFRIWVLLAVLGSKIQLMVPSFVHSVGYSAHTSKHAINISTQFFLLSSRKSN